MEAREGKVFGILVVRVVFSFQGSVFRGGRKKLAPRGFEKDLIKGASFGESKSTENRVMNQDLRQGPWVEHGLPSRVRLIHHDVSPARMEPCES